MVLMVVYRLCVACVHACMLIYMIVHALWATHKWAKVNVCVGASVYSGNSSPDPFFFYFLLPRTAAHFSIIVTSFCMSALLYGICVQNNNCSVNRNVNELRQELKPCVTRESLHMVT